MTPSVDSPSGPPRQTRVRQTIEQLRARILGGEWPLGAKIPTEPQLVEALGVGRNTVREAVKALVHAGVLECRQGSGTYVVSTDELAGAVGRRLTDARMSEVVEVRRAFEVEAARLAALRRTPDDLAALDRALAAREAAWRTGRAEAFVEADADLHVAIVAAAHNAMLAELYASVGGALRDTVAHAIGPDLTPERYVDHGRLVAAIRAGDPDRAADEAGAFLEAPTGA
ncbi:FadR/GntR family transcriptional regulator [Micromonospora echinofusca]|uniref:FCD domain-containing protein n=1 Tax=Micromonospora echinofusca TaxID=47858 RepID=A0ABS3VKU6_MICEH|nr:FCD domain-containing protein [Micromonospora echinofusca]MBO4205164.1 FCD domain-containing protein [Micromonospora echinofusca]